MILIIVEMIVQLYWITLQWIGNIFTEPEWNLLSYSALAVYIPANSNNYYCIQCETLVHGVKMCQNEGLLLLTGRVLLICHLYRLCKSLLPNKNCMFSRVLNSLSESHFIFSQPLLVLREYIQHFVETPSFILTQMHPFTAGIDGLMTAY